MSELDNIEERIEHWIGEKEAVQRSIDSLEARLQEVEESLDELADLADLTESVEDSEEQAWLFAQDLEEED
jgi:prefoldin subunit 5